MSDKKNEIIWNEDLIELLKQEFPQHGIFKGKILKDIFLQKNKKGKFELQLGFFDQDIVIYKNEEVMDIEDLQDSSSVKIHNIGKNNKNRLIVPSIIIELKYDGVNTHGIITYSNIASDIKSIFPKSKYIFALRFNSGSSNNKLLRNGKSFDNIIYFENKGNGGNIYQKGQFEKELSQSGDIKKKWDHLIEYIKITMQNDSTCFLK